MTAAHSNLIVLLILSYVAARKLDIVGHGTAYVRVKAINPYTFRSDQIYLADNPPAHKRTYRDYLFTDRPSRPKTIVTTRTTTTRYFKSYAQLSKPTKHVYLHVGTFRQKTQAIHLKRRLNHILATPVNISNPKTKHKIYTVHVGPIKDVATADRITNQLKRLGLRPKSI